MARRTFFIAIALVLALAAGACSSDDPEAADTTTTSSESASETDSLSNEGSEGESSVDGDAGGSAFGDTGDQTDEPGAPPSFPAEVEDQMCRTLALLQASGATAPYAANAIALTDLVGASPTDIFNYGNLLAAAPRSSCPEYTQYARDVAYWLGV